MNRKCRKKDLNCKLLRAQLAITSPITLPNGITFIFHNKLSYYDTLICIDASHPTIEQLTMISKELSTCQLRLCPMLVWAIKDGTPTLVKLRPGCRKPVKVMQTTSLYQLAYTIWIVSDDE